MLFDNNKMPSETTLLTTQTEKPHHYMYLKEFRTQQCSLFLQHKCTQHRPFTCFHWHFLNQRRRRPVRRREGSFNYSPDIYCTKYDETTGICPDGDECPFLHRTAGDTERRYHLRYYKTGTCVYETDSRGHCAKNGPHCAFAHGTLDLRPPVYDIHELQTMDVLDKVSVASSSPGSLEKDNILAEDPKWNDTNYVLANYKTEQCKRPPRLCRQGYACPQYHNSKDRRRSPKTIKYRSTPCPNVKHGDEWGDPAQCESGDSCAYCHNRTEQQFHPEIYKSTKCKDMVQNGYCPRGAFCAFAHVEQEMTTQRDITLASENSLAAFLTSALPNTTSSVNSSVSDSVLQSDDVDHKLEEQNGQSSQQSVAKLLNPIGKERANSISTNNSSVSADVGVTNHSFVQEPIGKHRSASRSSSFGSDLTSPHNHFLIAGIDREDFQVKLRQQIQAIENDSSLDSVEKGKRKQNLILLHNLNNVPTSQSALQNSIAPPLTLATSSTMSPHAPAFYPAGDTVESVIGHALDDLHLEDFDIASLEKELDRDNDTNSIGSSISTGLSTSGCFGTTSGPIGIPPSSVHQRGSMGSLSQSPPSPFGSFPHHSIVPLQVQKHDSTGDQHPSSSSPFLVGHVGSSKFHGTSINDTNSMSPRSIGPQSPMFSAALSNSHSGDNSEILKLKEDLIVTKTKLAEWEGVYKQAKGACEAWKKEAEESYRKAKLADDERIHAIKQRDESLTQSQRMKQELDLLNGGGYLRTLQRITDLEKLGLQALRHIRQTLKHDLDKIDEVIYQQTSNKCLVCQDRKRNVSTLPCSHRVLCDVCAARTPDCPFCHIAIQTTSVNFA